MLDELDSSRLRGSLGLYFLLDFQFHCDPGDTERVGEALHRLDVDILEPNFRPPHPNSRCSLPPSTEKGPEAHPRSARHPRTRGLAQLGIDGTGPVANCDTGVDGDHPALSTRGAATTGMPGRSAGMTSSAAAPSTNDVAGHGTMSWD